MLQCKNVIKKNSCELLVYKLNKVPMRSNFVLSKIILVKSEHLE